MIEYAKFLSKRMLHKKSIFVLILLSLVVISIFLVMNVKTQDMFKTKFESQIQIDMDYLKTNENKIKDFSKDSDEYLSYQDSSKQTKEQIELCKNILTSIDEKDWSVVYKDYQKFLKNQIGFMGEDNQSTEIVGSLKKELIYIDYLQKHNLTYEIPEFPITGLTFTTSISQIFLQVLIVVCCIYILVQLYTLDYMKDQDISILYPISRKKKICTKILMGVVISAIVFTFMILCSFLIATLFTGQSGIDYPIILQDAKNASWNVVSMLSFFKDWFILGILFSMSLSIFIYLLSLFIREDMYLLLIVSSVILGFYYLPNIAGELQLIAHNIPTTYISYVDVANGFLASRFSNASITTARGISVLSLSIVVQLFICVLLYNFKKIRKSN